MSKYEVTISPGTGNECKFEASSMSAAMKIVRRELVGTITTFTKPGQLGRGELGLVKRIYRGAEFRTDRAHPTNLDEIQYGEALELWVSRRNAKESIGTANALITWGWK